MKFKDLNFKLAVINALIKLGEFKDEIRTIKKNHTKGRYDAYYRDAKGDDWFGPHPDILKTLDALNLTRTQLNRVTVLIPEGETDLLQLIAPNWVGEDKVFDPGTLADLSLLPNIEVFGAWGSAPFKDCKPLLACPKLKRVISGPGHFRIKDKKTLKALQDRGLEIVEENVPGLSLKD